MLDHLSHRTMGVLLTLMGVVAAYWGFYAPIIAVLTHQPNLHLSYAAIFLSIVGPGVGLTMMIMGEGHIETFGHYRKPNLKGRIYALAFLAVAYVAAGRLEAFAKDHGYVKTQVNLL